MKMRTRFVAFVLVALLILTGIFGCGTDSSPSGNDNSVNQPDSVVSDVAADVAVDASGRDIVAVDNSTGQDIAVSQDSVVVADEGQADFPDEAVNDYGADLAQGQDVIVSDIQTDVSGLEHFSFFVTSIKVMRELSGSQNGFGGDLRYGETGAGAGLRGADKICTEVAEKSMPGSGAKVWRAFLSVTADENGQQVNAIDRVGSGPWYDRLGRVFALTKTDLLTERPTNCDSDICDDFPNEDGVPNHQPILTQPEVDNHDFLTGSDDKGELYSSTATCGDWTSLSKTASGKPRVGHSWPRSGMGFPGPGGDQSMNNWMSALDEAGCAAGVNLVDDGAGDQRAGTVGAGGGYGGIYCFALNP